MGIVVAVVQERVLDRRCAVSARMPSVLCVGLYRGANSYDVYCELVADELRLARNGRAAQLGDWAQRFAARLEHYTRLDFYNWFNFYDFWHSLPPEEAEQRQPAVAAGHAE